MVTGRLGLLQEIGLSWMKPVKIFIIGRYKGISRTLISYLVLVSRLTIIRYDHPRW
jgi:hypothetical protein